MASDPDTIDRDPLEVRLVEDVARCRACGWFWNDPPYGPYPAYSFEHDFPTEVPARARAAIPDPAPWLEARVTGNFVDPQILHGCRKAPVMTIGINPNLAAFWPGTSGARAAYPRFESTAQAAYHYRYRTLFQERVDPDFITRHASAEGALLAEGTGRMVGVDFALDKRSWQIAVAYDDPALGERTYPVEWDSQRNFVLLFDRARPDDRAQFSAGEPIAAFLDLPSEPQPATLFSEPVGYYLRMVPIIAMLEAQFAAMGSRANLSLGEDICQLDMVACSSPGWGAGYKIDKHEVTANCVSGHAWALKQLVQSRPAVIVFSGRSAYEMFHAHFPDRIRPDLDPRQRETYDLLATTCRWPNYVDLSTEAAGDHFDLRARILIAPHFSYDDNFVPHTRFSPRGWEQFRRDHPDALAALEAAGKILETSRDGYVPVDMRVLGDFQTRFPQAMAPLLRSFYDPLQMLGAALAQEAVMGNLRIDPATGRLGRSEGPCHFCSNARWAFPEGCAYAKPEEAPLASEYLEAVVAKLISDSPQSPGDAR